MNNEKLISVVLPVYNCKEYINDSVQSILQQNYKNFELIIVDDGSDDGTSDILNNFKDKRIRLYKNKCNRGLIYSLNKALNKSKGQFIARMDADDISEINRFQKQINYFNKNKEISVVGSAVKLIDSSNQNFSFFYYPLTDVSIKWSMLFCCPISHPSVMIKSSVIKKSRGYNLEAKFAEDYDLWFRLIKKNIKFANLPMPLIKLRKHSQNVSITNFSEHFFNASKVCRNIIEYNFNFLKKVNYKLIKCIFSLGKNENKQSNLSINFIFKIFKCFFLKNHMKMTSIDFQNIKNDALKRILKIWFRNIMEVNTINTINIIFKIFFFPNNFKKNFN
jgi:glycosyltransferase involved in cell wall biosynthesis